MIKYFFFDSTISIINPYTLTLIVDAN